MRSSEIARAGVKIDRGRGLVAPEEHVFKWTLQGRLENCDTRVRVQDESGAGKTAA